MGVRGKLDPGCIVTSRSRTLGKPGIIEGPSPRVLTITPSASLVSSPMAASAVLHGSAISAVTTPSPTPNAVRLSIPAKAPSHHVAFLRIRVKERALNQPRVDKSKYRSGGGAINEGRGYRTAIADRD